MIPEDAKVALKALIIKMLGNRGIEVVPVKQKRKGKLKEQAEG